MTHRFSLNLLCAIISLFSFSPVMKAQSQADDTDTCTLCTDSLKNPTKPDTISILQCNHRYHTHCIKAKERGPKNFEFVQCDVCSIIHFGDIPLCAEQQEEQKQPLASAENTEK
jgi:hypothetical protein